MKKILTPLFLLLFIGTGFSQSFIDNHFQHLVDDDNSTVISVSGDMFRYAAVLVDESHEDEIHTKDVLHGIKSLQFVGLEDAIDPEVEYQKGLRTIPEGLTEMVSVKSKGSKLKVYIDEEDDSVYEIIGIGIDDHSFFVGSILCEIRLEDINDVLSQMQAQDNMSFKKMWDVKYNELSVYPNPASTNSTLTIEIPDSMKGGVGTLLDNSGKTIKTFKLTNGQQELEIDNLSPGNYLLNIRNKGTQLQKKVLVVN